MILSVVWLSRAEFPHSTLSPTFTLQVRHPSLPQGMTENSAYSEDRAKKIGGSHFPTFIRTKSRLTLGMTLKFVGISCSQRATVVHLELSDTL